MREHVGLISQQGSAVLGDQQLHCHWGVRVQVCGFEDSPGAAYSEAFGVELVAVCEDEVVNCFHIVFLPAYQYELGSGKGEEAKLP